MPQKHQPNQAHQSRHPRSCEDLIRIFNHCFEEEFNTRLVKGNDEPVYIPANADQSYHAIYFAHGFFSSALHECAHWFIAGPERRLQEDYGYWYAPDGRNAEQQLLFQTVEIKPQAIESILSESAGHPFQISVDNLSGEPYDTENFKTAVFQQAEVYRLQGLPKRAERFRQALNDFYCKGLSEVLLTGSSIKKTRIRAEIIDNNKVRKAIL
jgi:elongation factor P hydroxylase